MTSPADLDAEVPLPLPDIFYQIPAQWNFGNRSEVRAHSGTAMLAMRAAAYRAGLEAAAKHCEDSELPRGDLLADQIRALKDRVHG